MDNDVDVVGCSSLAAGHKTLIPEIINPHRTGKPRAPHALRLLGVHVGRFFICNCPGLTLLVGRGGMSTFVGKIGCCDELDGVTRRIP